MTKNGIVGDLGLRVLIGPRVLPHDGGLIRLLSREPLELRRPGIVLRDRIVHRSAGELIFLIIGLVDEIQRTIGQTPEPSTEELIQRPRVDDGTVEGHVLHIDSRQHSILGIILEFQIEDAHGIRIQADVDALISQHLFE